MLLQRRPNKIKLTMRKLRLWVNFHKLLEYFKLIESIESTKRINGIHKMNYFVGTSSCRNDDIIRFQYSPSVRFESVGFFDWDFGKVNL